MMRNLTGLGKTSMLDVILNQIKGNIRFGNVIKNSDGTISIIFDEKTLTDMIMSSLSKARTNNPMSLEMLKSLMSVKIDKGRVEIRMRVM